MIERGFPFHDHVVRRLLDLKSPKTEIRRIIETQPDRVVDDRAWVTNEHGKHQEVRCYYGDVGDRIWVREAWTSWTENNHRDEDEDDDHQCDLHCHQVYVAYRATPRIGFRPVPDRQRICFLDESTPLAANKRLLSGWRAASGMMRDHARIGLEITRRRIHRLHDITDTDAIAEGIVRDPDGRFAGALERRFATARGAFESLWRCIYGASVWEANPWLWAISFQRYELHPNRASVAA